MRQGELAVVLTAQGTGPRVEYLQRLRARLDLRLEVVAHDRGKAAAQLVPRLGLRVHESLRRGVGGRRSAFDRVRGQRERRAAETDQRDPAGQLAAHQPDRFEHMPESLARLEVAQPRHIAGGANRLRDCRPFALDEIEVEPHRREGQQQVGEQDRGVHVKGIDRLQRHLDRHVGARDDLEQCVALAQRPVLGHIPAGLAHEPHRRPIHRLTAAGAQKAVVHEMRVRASAIRSSSQSGLNRIAAPSDFSSC